MRKGATIAGSNAQPHLIEREGRVVGGDDDIATRKQTDASANDDALGQGDRRL